MASESVAGDTAALVWSQPFAIELGWLDGNGHLDMAAYHALFARTAGAALSLLGLDEAYRAAHGASVIAAEMHAVYRHELNAADAVRVSFRLIGRDATRLHAFQAMVREAGGEIAATAETMFVHVDLARRRPAPLPPATAAAAGRMMAAQAGAEMPPLAGRRIPPLKG